MIIKSGYIFRPAEMKRLKTVLLLSLLFLLFINQEARSNVRPESLSDNEVVFNLSYFDDFGIISFSAKEKTRENPFPPVHPINHPKPQTGSEQCIIKESFRTYADRGNDPALLALVRFFIGYSSKPKTLIPYRDFILISSKTCESTRIRPPPAL